METTCRLRGKIPGHQSQKLLLRWRDDVRVIILVPVFDPLGNEYFHPMWNRKVFQLAILGSSGVLPRDCRLKHKYIPAPILRQLARIRRQFVKCSNGSDVRDSISRCSSMSESCLVYKGQAQDI